MFVSVYIKKFESVHFNKIAFKSLMLHASITAKGQGKLKANFDCYKF